MFLAIQPTIIAQNSASKLLIVLQDDITENALIMIKSMTNVVMPVINIQLHNVHSLES